MTTTRLRVFPSLLWCACIIVLAVAGGCSDEKPPSTNAAAPKTQTPEPPSTLDESAREPVDTDEEKVVAEVAAGGIPTRYVAYFDQDKLTRIDETRSTDQRSGSYEFLGARLVKYSGATLTAKGELMLRLSMQGAVESAQIDGAAASDDIVNAIRTRAQLLRSHALAQRSSRSHVGH